MTVPVRPSSSPDQTEGTPHPPLRLVRVRTPQPPAQDERIPVRLLLPGVAVPRPTYRPGPRPRSAVAEPADEFAPTLSARSDLPDVGAAGRRLITLALEVLSGRRPASQLQPLTTPGVYASLASGRRPRWCADGTAPLLVGRVHVGEPVDGVAEIAAVARRAGRAHAVAARLEGIDGRWRCTALQIG